ncbi:intercellular adhesion molecule 5-like [Pantherophis guttatus]|uniref:Intercellular adhesion molecule 5-like n=1 Tax=Pantherophis guttatus TaxID=94885 RepID=A0A6P9D3Z4_PANGU|nr:intercellular adhesion molecule 5-like [Pantherophis guttatus]
MQKFIFFFAVGAWAVTQGTTEEEFVEIWPPNPVVEFGGSLDLNCTSTCENIGIESAYTKIPIENGSNWKAFRLSNVDYWAASPLCYAECKTGQKKSPKANIIIYKSPESIELDPIPEMEVGKLYNFTCRVLGVAPIHDLTVTLLKGEEQLLIKAFQDHTRPEAGAVVVNHHIRAEQNDYNKTITCQTSLDLRPRGPLLKNTSHGISLWTFDFAKAPLLHAGLFLEAGTLMKVMCDAPEVSPAKEAVFDLWFAGKPLTFNTTVMGSLASAQAVIASSSVGDHELICTVFLGPVTKNVTKIVNVFALPKLIFQIGSSEAVINQTVNITCSTDGSASPGFKMQITDAAKILAFGNVDEHFLQHEMIAQQEDNKREFICQVILIVDGHTKERNISQNLTVFYGPQMDDSNCPHALTWKEGSTTSFTCSALGNPTPIVQCWKDGRPYNIGEPQLVQREHDGIYHCNATNQYGFDVRDVTIHVESHQPNILAIILGIAAIVILISLVGIVVFYINRRKFGIYHLWKRQQPQAAQASELRLCLNCTTNN